MGRFLGIEGFSVKPVARMPAGLENLKGAYFPNEGKVLLLCADEKALTLDETFALAHEAFHVYQQKCGAFGKDYVQRGKAENLEAYVGQKEELEANGFATAWLMAAHHRKPLFKGYSEETREAIYAEAEKFFVSDKDGRYVFFRKL